MSVTPTLPQHAIESSAASRPPVRFRDRVKGRVGMQELLVVRIGREHFAVPLEAVDELVESPKLRAVPGAPDSLLGLFTLGTALLPLYSPGGILGAESAGDQVALVMRGGAARVALAVDDADDVVRVDLADVIEAPRTGHHDDVVLGVIWHAGELLTLLDARAVVGSYAALPMEEA